MYKYPEYKPELFEHGISQYGDRPSPLGHFQQLYKDADEFGNDFDYDVLHSQLGYDEKTKMPKKIGNNASSYKYVTQSPVFQKMAENFDEEAYERMDGSNRAYERYLQEVLPLTEENFENKDMYDKYMNYLNSNEVKPLKEYIEDKIESNPEEAAVSLPEGSDIQKEAEQAIDGGKDAEVRNDVVEEAIKKEPGAFLNNDFFANYANTMLGGNGVTEDTLKPTGSIYSTPKIDRASHSDYVNGKIDRNEYMSQLSNQSSQAGEALKKASKMMDDERERYANEGGQFNRGHVGAYALPAGNAKNFADNRLNEMNEGFADIDAKAYSKNYKPEFYEGEDDLTISDMPKVEEIVEKEPEIIKEEVPEDNPIYKEAEQVTDGDERTSEANNEKVEEGIKNDSGIDWDAIEAKWNAEHEAIANSSSEYKDEFGREVPDFASNDKALSEYFNNTDELYDYLIDNGYGDDVFDPGLEDQNQYVDDINDKTIVDTKAPEVDENDFVKSDVLPSADNVLELKPEEQDAVTEAIEEAAPEEEKETYFGMLGIPHRQFGGSSHSSVNANNNEQYKLDRLNHAGAASLGRLGGFSTGSGSVSPGTVSTGISKPHNMTEHVSSRAGGGSIPKSPNAAANSQVGSRAGNSNNGFITSNGGNISSGPVQKRSSLKSPKPAQLPNFTGHTAPAQTNQLGSAEDLHGALIERIKGMLDNLDAETRKKLGFSPTLYNYNGTPIDKLDGATLVQISEMLEDMQNG